MQTSKYTSIPVYKFLSEAYRDIKMLAISLMLRTLNSQPTLFFCFSQLRGSQVRSVMVQAETNRQGLPPGQRGCGRLFGHTIFNQILQRSCRLPCPPCNNIWSFYVRQVTICSLPTAFIDFDIYMSPLPPTSVGLSFLGYQAAFAERPPAAMASATQHGSAKPFEERSR